MSSTTRTMPMLPMMCQRLDCMYSTCIVMSPRDITIGCLIVRFIVFGCTAISPKGCRQSRTVQLGNTVDRRVTQPMVETGTRYAGYGWAFER